MKTSSSDATIYGLGEPRPQCGAIVYRRAPNLEVLLVTSRETGRWVIPKGGRMVDRTPWETALTEAFEEAGVVGDIDPAPLGAYDYIKFLKSGEGVPCRVTVFALALIEQLDHWPEYDQRETRWFALADAIGAVHEAGLRALIQDFGARAVATPSILPLGRPPIPSNRSTRD